MACGQQDGRIDTNQQFDRWLTARGVNHVWRPTPGIHSFTVWRRYLAELAPLLFRGNP